MARLTAVLSAVWKATERNLGTLFALEGNNLFLVGIALLFMQDPGAFMVISAVMVVILFLPLSSDPLQKIPRDRFVLWPLSSRERIALRALTPFLNPMTWLVLGLMLWKRITLGLWGFLAGAYVLGFLGTSIHLGRQMRAPIPQFPGMLGELVRKNLRELFTMLDFQLALLLAVIASGYRLSGQLPSEAFVPLTLVIALPLSSYAQCLFGLEGVGGLTRYHLLPVPGWQILAAKGAAFLLVQVALCIFLSPHGALGAGLFALTVGHRASVRSQKQQTRWRFCSGGSLPSGAVQVLGMCFAGYHVARTSVLILAVCSILYAGSLWYFGRAFDRQIRD